MVPFVLDNSIRETTVVQLRGHVAADKDAILESLEGTGIDHIIVGAFGDLKRVDDTWLENKHKEGKIQENFYAFSEMVTDVVGGVPIADIPPGLLKIKKYGIKNCILEVDIMCTRRDPIKFSDIALREWIRTRLDFIRNEISPDDMVFVNFRDAPLAWKYAEGRVRMKMLIEFFAALPKKLAGLLFEDANGSDFHWDLLTRW
jgi:hypothetical protein